MPSGVFFIYGGVMLGWKAQALEMYRNRHTWPEITKAVMPAFGAITYKDALNKVRTYIRRTPDYQARQAERSGQTVRHNEDGSIVSERFVKLQAGQSLSPEDILALHGLDPCKWAVQSCTNNFWNSQMTGGVLQISYQSKLTAKPIKQGLDLDAIGRHFEKLKPPWTPPKRVYRPDNKRLAVVHIADLHINKLAWRGDTGNDYDLRIARDVYHRIIGEIVGELAGIERIIFCWANDFFNSDNEEQTTTRGTRQDTDSRWTKMFNVGCDMLVEGIARLAEIAPVETFYLPSNHDKQTAYGALKYIEGYYRHDKDITVDIDAYPRKYRRYGNVLLGFTHGDDEGRENASKAKASRLASVMPNEARKLWGETVYHEMHAGHLHSEQMIQEINGVIVRRVSSPTASDAWHVDSGYIGSVRKAQTFLYDKERGLIHTINTPV
jgi:hypothetical protein